MKNRKRRKKHMHTHTRQKFKCLKHLKFVTKWTSFTCTKASSFILFTLARCWCAFITKGIRSFFSHIPKTHFTVVFNCFVKCVQIHLIQWNVKTEHQSEIYTQFKEIATELLSNKILFRNHVFCGAKNKRIVWFAMLLSLNGAREIYFLLTK